MLAPSNFDQRTCNPRIGHAQCLQQQRRERDASFDTLEAQVNTLLVDLQQIEVHPVRGRTADSDDPYLDPTHAVWDQAGDELEPGLGECRVVERPGRQRQQHEHGESRRNDDPAAHQSLGEKLMCRRGPAGRDSGSATSMPSVTTGRRQRTPIPAEYSMKW